MAFSRIGKFFAGANIVTGVAAVTALIAGMAIPCGAKAGVLDDFNRPDSRTLGPNWTGQNGNAGIVDNQAEGDRNQVLETYNGVGSNSATVDVSEASFGVNYVALVLGYADLNDNYFIKVQDNGSGEFSTYGFYYGNNGKSNDLASTTFGTLISAFSTGTMTATLKGSVVTLDITPTGGTTQVYKWNYGLANGASGIGLGFYGTGLADNFGTVSKAVPEPASLAMFGAAVAMLAVQRRAGRRKV